MLLVCERMEALIAARDEGTLDVHGAGDLEAHLAVCAACGELARPGLVTTFPEVDPKAYDFGPEIGFGGMGTVRRARDRRTGRDVAIKELLFHTEALAIRFVREARITAMLQHPGIIPIYEVGAWPDGTPFYAMRLVEGVSLFTAIARAPEWSDRALLVPRILAAADAVAYAHSRGVVHRDLTPSNILLGEFGETVVIDWGLAKDVRCDEERDAEVQQIITAKGEVLGSAAYMPPEQAIGEPVDRRADVYALGAILRHVITGRAPYAEPAPTPRSLDPGLRAVIERATADHPDARYADAEAFAHALRRAIGASLAPRPRRQLPAALAGLAAIAFGFVMFAS